MRRFLLAIALSIAFTSRTLAGDVPSGDYTPPPPPPDQTRSTTQIAIPGDVPTSDSPAPSSAMENLIIMIVRMTQL